MAQQGASSTLKESFRGSLSLGQTGSSSGSSPARGSWEQSLDHSHRTSQFYFENSMENYLDPHGVGFCDSAGNALPMTHSATSLSPGETDSIYLFGASFDAFSQYGSSQASPNNIGDYQHLGHWNYGLPAGADRSSSGNSNSVTQFGIAPEDPGLGNFDAVMAGFGSNLVLWQQRRPMSPSQNSSATGPLPVSTTMDYPKSNSSAYRGPSIVSDPIERPQFDAYAKPIAAAAPTPGMKAVAGNKRKPSAKGTKKRSRKTSTPIVESSDLCELPTPSSKFDLRAPVTADDESFSAGPKVSETHLMNGEHNPRSESNNFQTYQTLPGSQRQRNRQAATKCREKTKAAMAQLEATEKAITLEHMELSKTVAELRGEVLALKNELLLHGNCDCEVIQQYLNNAARNIGASGSVNHTASQGSIATWTTASGSAGRKSLS